jgi:hypothetical protein
MMQTQVGQLMQANVAAIRAHAVAEHPEIVNHLHEEIREPQPDSEIPPWTTNQLQSQT